MVGIVLGLGGMPAESATEIPSSSPSLLVEDTLLLIPVGDDAEHEMAYEPDLEEECCPAPPAGIPAVSVTGEVYVFDFANGHIKVLSRDGLRIIPGPATPDSSWGGRPLDIAVAGDIVYLLADLRSRHEDGSDRFHIYRWTPADKIWQRIAFPHDIKAGTGDVSVLGGIYITHEELAELYSAPEGTLYLYHRGWRTSYPLVSGSRVYSESEQLELAIDGRVAADGGVYEDMLPAGGTSAAAPLRGFLLGADRFGRIYTCEYAGYESILRVYERGLLTAEGTLNLRERDLSRAMEGAGNLLVGPSGGIYVFQPKENRFMISRLLPAGDSQ